METKASGFNERSFVALALVVALVLIVGVIGSLLPLAPQITAALSAGAGMLPAAIAFQLEKRREHQRVEAEATPGVGPVETPSSLASVDDDTALAQATATRSPLTFVAALFFTISVIFWPALGLVPSVALQSNAALVGLAFSITAIAVSPLAVVVTGWFLAPYFGRHPFRVATIASVVYFLAWAGIIAYLMTVSPGAVSVEIVVLAGIGFVLPTVLATFIGVGLVRGPRQETHAD